ncbi:DUF6380 family protein [Streptomyces luteogriseus]|uniref:DUF6380 family protein n=1 Tax=Streptomyces luteogriseus TaxID=68233 RepID=UPI003AF39F6C
MTTEPAHATRAGGRARARRSGADRRLRAAPGSAAPRSPQAPHETGPVPSPVRRRGRAAVGEARSAGSAPASVAGRGHDAPHGHAVGDNRRATLRRGAASLTETAGRAPFERHALAMGEGA